MGGRKGLVKGQALTMKDDSFDTKLVLQVLKEVKRGNFDVRLPDEWTGTGGKIADALNEIIETNEKIVHEFHRVSQAVGKKGKLSERVSFPGASGGWNVIIESVNGLIDDSVRPTNEMARVIGAVAKGDLTQTVSLEAEGYPLKGEFMTAAKTVNTMVDQLQLRGGSDAGGAGSGHRGKLGGQAVVPGVAGTWKDLTDKRQFDGE